MAKSPKDFFRGMDSPDDNRLGSQTVVEVVRDKAHALGFDVVAFARADVPLEEDFARYRAFVAAGMHGEMD